MNSKIAAFFLISSILLPAAFAPSASAEVLTTEGVSGDIDAKRRSPLLSVSVEPRTLASGERDGVKLLVDAMVPNKEFVRYPLRFDFFINRHLVSTQMRSAELPGPIGLDVSRAMAATPFNYSIVATVLHPNRQYMTVLHGAVFGTNLVSNLECEATVLNRGRSMLLISEEFQTAQRGDNQLVLDFRAQEQNEADEDEHVGQIEAVLDLADPSGNSEQTAAQGSVTYGIEGGDTVSVSVSGEVTFTDAEVSGATLESSDGTISIACGEALEDSDDEEDEASDEEDELPIETQEANPAATDLAL